MSSQSTSHDASSSAPSSSSSTAHPAPHAQGSLQNHDDAHAGLEQVIAHLERLKAFTARTGNDLGAKRTLLEGYFAADASILDTGVTPRLEMLPEETASASVRYCPHQTAHRHLHVTCCTCMGVAGSPAPPPVIARWPAVWAARRAPRPTRWIIASPLRRPSRQAWKTYWPHGTGCAASFRITTCCWPETARAATSRSTPNALKSAGERLPDAVIAFSPATDLSWGSASLSRKAEVDPILDPNLLPFVSMAYVQDGTDMSDPRISPLEGDLFDLPPTLIQCGEAEILLDDSRRYAARRHRIAAHLSRSACGRTCRMCSSASHRCSALPTPPSRKPVTSSTPRLPDSTASASASRQACLTRTRKRPTR